MELEILELKTAIEKLIKELYKNFSLHIKSQPPRSNKKTLHEGGFENEIQKLLFWHYNSVDYMNNSI